MTISFSGIGSGNDWSSLIDQLVAIERQPADKLTTDKSNANKQLSVVGDLLSRLGTLSSRATAMSTASKLWSVAATSSAEGQVKVLPSGGGSAGAFALRVEQLARGESRRSSAFTSANPGLDGSVSISLGGATAVAVAYSATDSLSDIAARITDKVSGVTATALYDGTNYRLLLTSSATGATAGAMTITGGANLGLNAGDAITRAALDARVTVNGVTATSASNHMTGVIPGVALDLVSVTAEGAPDVQVTLARDTAGLKQKVKDLASAFNSVAGVLTSQLSYTGVKRGQDTLFGDLATQRLQAQLGGAVASAYGGSNLGKLGVSVGKDGTLTVDEAKLDAAIAADPTAVEKVFTGDTGLAATLQKIADANTSSTGPYVTRQSSLRDRMKRDDDGVTRINDRAEEVQTRLKRQFAALDKALSLYSSQMSFLSSLTTKTE